MNGFSYRSPCDFQNLDRQSMRLLEAMKQTSRKFNIKLAMERISNPIFNEDAYDPGRPRSRPRPDDRSRHVRRHFLK